MPDDAKLLQRYLVDAPALYVTEGVYRIVDDMGVLAFTVGIVVRNVGGNTQARLGDGQSISADQLLTLVIRALHGRRIGDASWNIRRAEYLEPVDVFEAAGLTVVGVSVESTPMALPDDPEEIDGLGDLRHVHLDMDIAPHASHEEHENGSLSRPITPPTGLTCRLTFRWLAPAPTTDIRGSRMQTVTLKPAVIDGEPLKVRKPQGGYLATQGEPIVLTTYWRRRRDDGDVVAVDETQPGVAAPADPNPADTPVTPAKSASAKGAKAATE